MAKEKMTPGIGEEAQISDPISRMLKQAEEGKLGGTLRSSRPEGKVIQRPFQPYLAPPRDDSQPPSKAPRGMANAVMGDLGAYRQSEAKKVFPGLAGKDESNPLRYRKPATDIDSKFGPGDRIA